MLRVKRIVTILLQTILLHYLCMQNGLCQQLSPVEVVDNFCRYDLSGGRMAKPVSPTPDKAAGLKAFDSENEELNKFYIIHKYQTKEYKTYSDYAYVNVEYEILCEVSRQSVMLRYRNETVRVELIKTPDGWKMQTPIYYPRVYIKAGMDYFQALSEQNDWSSAEDRKQRTVKYKDMLFLLQSISKRLSR
jgi:hypothetical protein